MSLEAVPASLFRHPAWLAWKETQGWRQRDTGLGFALLHRDLKGIGSMAYAASPHALPGVYLKAADDRGAILEDLSERLFPSLPTDCAFIRWDLMTSAWTDGTGRPIDIRLQEMRMNASTRCRRLRKAALENTCLDTMVVDLEGGESAIWARMDERTRYSVRLAARRGTLVERVGERGLARFYALHEKTAARQKLPLQPEARFRDLFRAARDHGLGLDLYMATTAKGEAAASAIVAQNRDSAWYLFAASSAEHRAAAGPSAILHRAMIDCSEAGIERMDLLGVGPAGVDDHPLSGLTMFKSGFGGRRMTRAGAWDYVVRPDDYARFAQAENLA